MRLLLDACVDRRLVRRTTGHSVSTVSAQRWAGISDHVPRYHIAVVVLRSSTNRLADLELLMPALLARVETLRPGDVCVIPEMPAA
jgi:hypothetical protein